MKRKPPLFLLLLLGLSLHAAGSDRQLVERLEAATTSREQHDILDEIAERIADEPFAGELTDRLIAELMSEAAYGYHHIMRLLPRLAGDRGFSEQSLVNLAKGLSGEMTRQYDAARGIAAALSAAHGDAGLPDAAFSELIAALEHVAMLNRSAAIDVLAVTRQGDERYGAAMAEILRALNDNEHEHTRSSAIHGLTRLAGDGPLPGEVTAGLVRSATGDPYMTVRIDALELLATRDIDVSLREKLSASLAAEIISPTHELWTRSSGLRSHDGLAARATAVLADLYEPPYPQHVIDAWIVQTADRQSDKSLEALRGVHERGEFTAGQLTALLRVAESHRRPADREKIYAMLFARMDAETIANTLLAFEHADEESDRIRAGYALKEQYRGVEVADRVADIAARVALVGSSEELRTIAAILVSRSRRDREWRERQLLAALMEHPDENGIQTSIISLYGADRMEELVVAHASNPALSVTFRRRIVHELGQGEKTPGDLPSAVENTLKDIARVSDDYLLVQNAGESLKAWGIRPPLRVALQNHGNQSMALFVILVILVVINAIAAIIALVAIFRLPLRTVERGKRAAIRSGIVVGLAVITVGMLVLLGAGVVGFLGHNSAPSPAATLLWNIPAYVGTAVYIFLVWLLTRRANTPRQSH